MSRAGVLVVTLAAAALLAAAGFAHGWPGRPPGEPPRLKQSGPPPAWIETRARSRWLHFSSYCWHKVCVEMPPVQKRGDLRVLTARPGELLRMHLAFRPRKIHLTIYRRVHFTHYRLLPQQILSWRAHGSGVIALDAESSAGSASYLIRLQTR